MYKLIFILIVLDYILTYIGVSLNIIYEANPLMVTYLNLPFSLGIFLRILIAGGLIYFLFKTRNKKLYTKIYNGIELTQQRKIIGNSVIYVILGIQLVIYFFHALWIIQTIKGVM